jgi:hypothetical protein
MYVYVCVNVCAVCMCARRVARRYLKEQMPMFMGREKMQEKLMRDLPTVFRTVLKVGACSLCLLACVLDGCVPSPACFLPMFVLVFVDTSMTQHALFLAPNQS